MIKKKTGIGGSDTGSAGHDTGTDCIDTGSLMIVVLMKVLYEEPKLVDAIITRPSKMEVYHR